MARLKFDENYHVEDFTFVLSTQGKKHLGAIGNIETKSVIYKRNLNSANEVSFEVYKELNDRQERLWDDIDDLKLIWVKDTNEYFSIEVQLDDSDSLKKSITATSLGEVETSQTIIYGLEINTEDDIARDDYVITKFYDSENPEGSLLHRVLSFMPHYSIKHVDSSLKDLQRTFSVDGTSVYDFLTGECAEQFNCIFIIDSANRTISAYDLYAVCRDCGYRGEFNEVCPECGSTNLKYFGDDTTIFVDRENLAESITFTTDVDSIKNCFKLEAGDDNMTAAVINCNPNGTDRIYCISPEQRKDMSDELIKKLDLYDELYNYYTKDYQDIMSGIYECIDKILYYTSEMMPTIDIDETSSAADQAAKLTIANLSPTALSKLSSSTSVATVNSALKNYASIYIKTGYFKVEINQSSFSYKGTEGSHHYGNWTGSFKVTNYSDEEDVAITPTMVIKITDDYETFLNQKIEKSIKSNDTDDGSVFDVLSISNQSKFESSLTLYCLNRLTSFYDAIQGVIDIMIEQNQASKNSDLYNSLYLPYYNKLVACQKEIDKRQATINEWERKQENLQRQKNIIQDALNFKDFLGDELYLEFCVYKREDKYSNSNYISDGLDNAEIFENAKEFFETAKKELVKASTHQHSISANLYNLLAMKEFEPLVDNFEVGNWIRIGLDGKVYRLRLVSYEISFSDIQNINVEFSDLIMVNNVANDIESILKSAQSMASSYGYVSKQAEKGNSANSNINKWVEDGLNSALVQIKNNDKEEITCDKHGILCRSYDDITDSYSDEQLKITHNTMVFSDDGFKSAKTALGKHQYTYWNGSAFVKGTGYGLSSEFVQAGHIVGSQIIGGDIYSSNYSSTTGTHIDLNNGQFSFGGGALKWDGTTLTISSPSIPSKVSQLTNDSNFQNAIQVTQITKDTVTAPFIQTLNLTVGNEIKMGSDATITWSQVTGTDNIATKNYVTSQGYETASSIKSTVITKDYIESLEVKAGSVDASNITGTTISGKAISGGSITIGSNFKVDSSGNMTSASGTIGGINIGSTGLYYSGSSSTDGFGIWKNGVHSHNNNYIIMHAGGNNGNIGSAPFRVYQNGNVVTNALTATGGKVGGLNIYETSAGKYLETEPSKSGLTAGIGNSRDWNLWAGWNGKEATFWVTENGEVHMRNWLYGVDEYTWATWTKRSIKQDGTRFGVNYIFGDWTGSKMNVKIVFYDHSKTPPSVGYVSLGEFEWHDGNP